MAAEPLILLAGGKAERMGRSKALLDAGGRTWLEWQLAEHQAARGQAECIVVIGYHAERQLEEFRRRAIGARVMVNPEPERGPFSSLQLGLRACDGEAYVLPIDVPCPRRETWAALDAARAGAWACIPTSEGRGGHPVWISRALGERLLSVPPDVADARLDRQLAALDPSQVRRVAVVDPRVRANLNTPEEFSRFLAELEVP